MTQPDDPPDDPPGDGDSAQDTTAHELELLEPDFSLGDCLDEARGFLECAQAEVDGTEHPAIADLMAACAWLLAALEAMQAMQAGPTRLPS